jgi:hypothetical protein
MSRDDGDCPVFKDLADVFVSVGSLTLERHKNFARFQRTGVDGKARGLAFCELIAHSVARAQKARYLSQLHVETPANPPASREVACAGISSRSERFARHFAIVKVRPAAGKNLIRLVTFARDQYGILRRGLGNRSKDRSAPIGDQFICPPTLSSPTLILVRILFGSSLQLSDVAITQ